VIAAPPPPAAVSVAPSRLALPAGAAATLRVLAPGRAPAIVDARVAGYTLDLRGRPRLVGRPDPTVRVSLSPSRLVVSAGREAAVTVSAHAVARAAPGDHAALVLLSTRPRGNAGVAVRMQLGVVVLVRVPGAIVHRLALGRVHVVRRTLRVFVRNGGNVAERIGPRELAVELRRAGRVVARLRARTQELLPHSAGVVVLALPRGKIRAVVTFRGGETIERRVVATGRAGRRSRRR